MGALWKILSDAHEKAFRDVKWTGNRVDDEKNYQVLPASWYHILTYADNSTRELTFFNAAQQDHVTNVNNGLLPDGEPTWIQSMSIQPVDFSAAGAVTSSFRSAGAASQATVDNISILNVLLQAANVQAWIGDTQIINDQGADRYPAGAGLDLAAVGVSGTIIGASGNNGAPFAGAVRRFPVWLPWIPGKTAKVVLKWIAAIDLAADTRLKVTFDGLKVIQKTQT